MKLLDKNKKHCKANLHCHTTLSDGERTPQEMKEYYMAHGYSVVAFTDHEILYNHADLCDENFIALNGVEIATNDEDSVLSKQRAKKGLPNKSAHFNFIAKSQDITIQPTYNTEYDWLHSEEEKSKVKSILSQFNRRHTTEDFNKVIKIANENGFLSIYNHSHWSLHNYEDYKDLENLFAVEIFNTSGMIGGSPSDENVYRDCLRIGKRLFCVAGDDNHRIYNEDDALCEECKSFVMIESNSLSYNDIIEALEKGKFYTSQGPKFYQIEIIGNLLKVECTPVKKIIVESKYSNRKSKIKYPKHQQKTICYAEFELNNAEQEYFLIHIIDENGNSAYTNPYFNMIK